MIPTGALLLLLAPSVALAEDAEALLQKGIVQFRMGMFEESAQTFEQASRATVDPALLGRIQLKLGVSHGVLKQTDKARAAFRAALGHDPSLSLREGKVKGAIVTLFKEVRAGIKGDLRITADRPGARVRVDGQEVGTAPHRAKVPVGKHLVEQALYALVIAASQPHVGQQLQDVGSEAGCVVPRVAGVGFPVG